MNNMKSPCIFFFFLLVLQINVPAGSETMTWILWIGPWSSEKKHKGISMVMVRGVAMTTPPLFRATIGLLEGIGGAEIKQHAGDAGKFFLHTTWSFSAQKENVKQRNWAMSFIYLVAYESLLIHGEQHTGVISLLNDVLNKKEQKAVRVKRLDLILGLVR